MYTHTHTLARTHAYTVIYFTGIVYAVVRQIFMLFINSEYSVFCIKDNFIGETEFTISQSAGDPEITLEGDNSSFEATIKTISTFGKTSGLSLNAGKTSAIWFGSKRNSPVKYMPH